MGKFTIQKDFGTFSAAHQLPNHGGKCRNLHGHEYRVVGEFALPDGRIDTDYHSPSEGMVVDFGVIKDVYKREIETRLDHALILGTVPLKWVIELVGFTPDEGAPEEIILEFQRQMHSKGVEKVAVLPIPVTTAEYMAQWMFETMQAGLSKYGVAVEWIEVFETPTSSARYSRE